MHSFVFHNLSSGNVSRAALSSLGSAIAVIFIFYGETSKFIEPLEIYRTTLAEKFLQLELAY
jgi:hypothetical protein